MCVYVWYLDIAILVGTLFWKKTCVSLCVHTVTFCWSKKSQKPFCVCNTGLAILVGTKEKYLCCEDIYGHIFVAIVSRTKQHELFGQWKHRGGQWANTCPVFSSSVKTTTLQRLSVRITVRTFSSQKTNNRPWTLQKPPPSTVNWGPCDFTLKR